MILGKLTQQAAKQFVSQNASASLGSMSTDGLQRVSGPQELSAALLSAGGVLADPIANVPATECVPCNQTKTVKPPSTAICQHRGSQRRASCCAGVLLDRWICRLLKQKDGTTPMDCVLTDTASQNHLEHAPSAEAEEWRQRVAVCGNCPHFAALPPGMASQS